MFWPPYNSHLFGLPFDHFDCVSLDQVCTDPVPCAYVCGRLSSMVESASHLSAHAVVIVEEVFSDTESDDSDYSNLGRKMPKKNYRPEAYVIDYGDINL